MFLPLFSFSPEEIFKGDILLFDVNFFNPQKEVYARTEITTTTSTTSTSVDGVTTPPTDQTDTTERDILITSDTDLQKELDHSDESSTDSNNNGLAYTTTSTKVEEKVKYYYYINDDGEEVVTSRQNMALELQPLVSQWYNAIRNIAIVASMSVLLYVGIRMLLSSVSQEKAKYKQMLIDWVVGVCLLFFMHYIMAFSVEIVQAFNKIISTTTSAVDMEDTIKNGSNGSAGHLQGMDQIVLMEDDEEGYISDKLEELGMSEELVDDSTDPAQIMWPTNLMGMLRLKAQVSYGDMAFVGYGICYVILVLFTVYFTYVYLRRVLYMAFLTMIAPLVALTYPIDKISDGQAQGFNKWLKEYIFNLLIQPLHLLLYTLLVTSAYELASTNPVYSLVAIGFMIPAEKLMRSLFGFEKASTPGSVAGAAAGAAMLNSGLQKLLHKEPGGKNGKGKNGGGDADGGDEGAPPRIGYNANEEEDEEEDEAEPGGIDAGGASAADAALYNNEDPRTRMEREALEEQIANGEIDESELTNEQKALLERNNVENQANNEAEDPGIRMEREALEEQIADGQINKDELTDEQKALLGMPQSFKSRLKNRAKSNTSANKDFLRRAGSAARYTLRQGGRKLTKMAPKAIRTGAKLAAGAALGATAAAAGATIGIATGDPSNAFTFAAGAGVAGGALGTSRVNTNPSQTKSAAQIARERAFWGEDYDKHVAEENMKKWKKDVDKRDNLERYLGREKTKELYDNGTIDKYLKHEITSEKDIAALERLQEKNSDINFKDALLVFDAYDKYGDIDRQKDKDKKDIRGGYAEKFQKSGASEKRAKEKAERITGLTTDLDSIKKNFR